MINLREVKARIKSVKDWRTRCRDIEIFHSHFILSKNKWSIRKTAKLLNILPSTACEDLQLARFLINDPSLERFRRRKDALAFIKHYNVTWEYKIKGIGK